MTKLLLNLNISPPAAPYTSHGWVGVVGTHRGRPGSLSLHPDTRESRFSMVYVTWSSPVSCRPELFRVAFPVPHSPSDRLQVNRMYAALSNFMSPRNRDGPLGHAPVAQPNARVQGIPGFFLRLYGE